MYTQVCGVRGVQLEGSGGMLFSDDTKELQSTFDTWAYHAQDNAGMRNVRCYLCIVGGWVLAALMGCGVGMQNNLRPAACFCGMQSVYDVSLRMRQRAVLTSCFVLRALCAVPCIKRNSMDDGIAVFRWCNVQRKLQTLGLPFSTAAPCVVSKADHC